MASTRRRTHFIMRHFGGQQEIYRWRTQPPFDGFVVNIQYDDQAAITEIAKMVASGKKYFRYYSMIDYQFSATNFGGIGGAAPATFFNWIRDNVQFNGSASNKRMRVSNTVGLFSAYNYGGIERRELIPWKDLTGATMQALAQKMVDLAFAPGGVAIPCAGLFIDQSWLSHSQWMHTNTIESGHGDLKEGTPHLTPFSGVSQAASFAIAETNFGTPSSTWADHTNAYLAFMAYLKTRLEIANPAAYLIPNGEHNTVNSQTMPKPWFVENAWNNTSDLGIDQAARWASAQAHWLTDKKNILNIMGFETLSSGITGFPDALALWKANGGWLSFISNGSIGGDLCAEQGYMDAAMIQGGIY